MLNFRAKDLVLRDEHVYLFIRDNTMQWTNNSRPALHGRIFPDFRYPGLEMRIKEEAGRLKEKRTELKQVRMVTRLDPSKISKRCVRLPLKRTCNEHLYLRRTDGHGVASYQSGSEEFNVDE